MFKAKGYLISTHEDINDKDQTVEVGSSKPDLPDTGKDFSEIYSRNTTRSYGTVTSNGSLSKTGGEKSKPLFIVGMIIIVSALTLYFVYVKRARENN